MFLVFGAQVPFVLRPNEDYCGCVGRNQILRLVGEAYVHDVMDGNLLERESGVLEMEEDFEIF